MSTLPALIRALTTASLRTTSRLTTWSLIECFQACHISPVQASPPEGDGAAGQAIAAPASTAVSRLSTMTGNLGG